MDLLDSALEKQIVGASLYQVSHKTVTLIILYM